MEGTELLEVIIAELIKEWRWVRGFVYPVVRPGEDSADKYGELLSADFLNLKIYYKIMFPIGGGNMATVKVTYDLLGAWGITESELQENAMNNMMGDGYVIRDILSVCREIFGGYVDRDSVDLEQEMYVLTNGRKAEGAAGILDEGMIGEFAEKRGADLYILPSSIQEIILLPFSEQCNAQMLKEMVMEINESQVEEGERLGDSIYVFSRQTGKIQIALQ